MIRFFRSLRAHFEGEPITDYDAFNADGVSIYSWPKFYQTNNTFQELVNSGNLVLISNEAIKTGLMDLQKLVSNFGYVASGGSSGNKATLDAAYFEEYLKSLKLKNGFAMTILEFGTMNEQMTMMKQMSKELIASIDQEIAE